MRLCVQLEQRTNFCHVAMDTLAETIATSHRREGEREVKRGQRDGWREREGGKEGEGGREEKREGMLAATAVNHIWKSKVAV